MKKIIFFFILIGIQSLAYQPAELRYSPEQIFDKVLKIMNLEKMSFIPFPELVFANKANLEEFQEDVFPQWGMKPDFITNVYIAHRNKIYLLDDKRYYEENGRCIDDSLAHELVHYIQVKYRNIPIEYFDDGMELEAIDIQSRFRDVFCTRN